jgi:hypothetical protein
VAPLYCFRCKKIFETQDGLISHLAVPDEKFLDGCKFRDEPYPEGMTLAIEKQIAGRWPATTPETDRWIKIYQILFPKEHVPDPCEPIPIPLQLLAEIISSASQCFIPWLSQG